MLVCPHMTPHLKTHLNLPLTCICLPCPICTRWTYVTNSMTYNVSNTIGFFCSVITVYYMCWRNISHDLLWFGSNTLIQCCDDDIMSKIKQIVYITFMWSWWQHCLYNSCVTKICKPFFCSRRLSILIRYKTLCISWYNIILFLIR